MSNNLLTISMISLESLRILSNVLGFAKGVNRQYDNTFANTGAKIGSVINIRKPVRYLTTTGPALQLQDINDQYCGLTLSTQAHVDFQFNSKDMTLSVDMFADRYLKTAVNALANKVDFDGLTNVNTQVSQAVGSPGTTPNSALVILQANQKLSESSTPFDGQRYLAVNPAAEASMVDALKGLFQKGDSIAQQYEKALMGVGLGFNWMVDQNVQEHTVGAYVGSATSNGVNQTGASIATSGWTGSVTNLLLAGDIITFANVYACNPVSFASTGALKQFVVTSNVNSSSGNATIPVFPSVTANGPYQNIATSAGVANGSSSGIPTGSSVTVLGSANTVTANNIAYHRDAFVLGMADLDMPGGVEMAARARDPQIGMALRVVRAYDIVNDQHPCRLDILYGWQTVYPELACRVMGA